MDLCGHATLAAAYCLKSILTYSNEKIIFKTLSGDLTVLVKNDLYYLDLPSRMPILSELPELIKKSLNIQPLEVHKSRDYLLVASRETPSTSLKRKIEKLKSQYGIFAPERNPWVTVRDMVKDLPNPRSRKNTLKDHTFRGGAKSYPGHTGSYIDEPSNTNLAFKYRLPRYPFYPTL